MLHCGRISIICSLLGCTASLQGAPLSPLTQAMKFNCQSQDNHSPLPVSLDEFLPLAHSTPLKTSAKKLPPVCEVGSKRKNTLLMTLQKRKRMKRFDLIKAYAINYISVLLVACVLTKYWWQFYTIYSNALKTQGPEESSSVVSQQLGVA